MASRAGDRPARSLEDGHLGRSKGVGRCPSSWPRLRAGLPAPASLLISCWLTFAGGAPGLAEPSLDPNAGAPAAESTVETVETAAQNGSPTFDEVIIVTATAREQDRSDLPFVTDELDMQELMMERQVRTVPEALTEVPGVMVQKTSHGQGSPYIRGFTGFRTLLLIDGVRLNNSVMRDGPNQYWNTVDPFGLERLEAVKGPVSVLYGSDSIGGTVQALTRETPAAGGAPIAGRVHLRLASAERASVGRLELRGAAGNRLGYSLGVTGKNFGDVEAGGAVGRQPKTGYDERDADLKLRYSFAGDTELVAAWQLTDLDDAWRSHRTVFARPWRGTAAGSEKRRVLDQRRRLGYLRLDRDRRSGWFDALSATVSLHRQQEKRDRVRSDDRRDLQGFSADTLGLGLRLTRSTSRSTWTFGAESYDDTVSSFREDFDAAGRSRGLRIQGPVADDADYRLSGIYVQNQAGIGSRLSLISGLRYTRAETQARAVADPLTGQKISVRGDWDQLTGSLRASYTAGSAGRWRLFGGVSQAFRAPNLSDLTRFDSARSNELETPAPDLRPEEFLSYEAGIRRQGRRWRAELAAFYTDLEDLIIRTPTGRTIDGELEVTKRNGGTGFSRGVELSLEGTLSRHWTAFSSASWLDGEADTSSQRRASGTQPDGTSPNVREPLDRLMPPSGQFGARWSTPGGRFWLESLLALARRADELSSRDRADVQRIPPGGTPGYAVWTLRGGWRGDRWAASAAIENLTDEEYRIHGSGLNEPGRSFVTSIEIGF